MFASRGMLNLFQLRDLDALTQRLHGADPGARRLLELAANLPVGGAQRLERLRFFFGPLGGRATTALEIHADAQQSKRAA